MMRCTQNKEDFVMGLSLGCKISWLFVVLMAVVAFLTYHTGTAFCVHRLFVASVAYYFFGLLPFFGWSTLSFSKE